MERLKVFYQNFIGSLIFSPRFSTRMNLRVFIVSSLLVVTGAIPAFAQYEDDNGGYDNYYDYESNPDSTETDPYGGYEDYDNYGTDDEDKPKKPEKKPYVRIQMPYDTLTELIHYTGIVEQEESYYDSLYIRAKRYLITKFSLKEKDFKESETTMDKIVMTLQLPYHMQKNKYVKEHVGNLEFKLALRFKDGKYKYDIDHLKHVYPENASGTSLPEYAYLEYYMRAERNIIYHDLLLRAADKEINSLIGEIRKALKEPVYIDEDDW